MTHTGTRAHARCWGTGTRSRQRLRHAAQGDQTAGAQGHTQAATTYTSMRGWGLGEAIMMVKLQRDRRRSSLRGRVGKGKQMHADGTR